jgi:hypothetical protein
MHIRKRYLLLLGLVLVAVFWLLNTRITETKESRRYNLNLQQLRGVTKLVIWEQDFTLNDVETQEKTYFKMFTSRESVATTVNGKMGFHIDLSDSVHTRIEQGKDSILIRAPLQITYVSLDMGTLQQIKEASLDPSLNIDKNEIIKHLDQRALEKYLPVIEESLRNKPLTSQELQLSRLTGKPVRIQLTQMPRISDWRE